MEDESIKIVVCDDHMIYRQGIRYILDSKPDVEIIGEADDGLKLLKLLKHVTPDVVLLDINMPVMDGTAALPQLKREYPHIKVLILSMQNTPEMIKIMMELGADGYLTKNDNETLIYEAIKECYHKGRFIDKRTEDVLLESIRRGPTKQEEPVVVKPTAPPSPPAIEFESTEADIIEEEPKETIKWYNMLLRPFLIGIGIAFAVVLGLYVYDKFKGALPSKNAYIGTQYSPYTGYGSDQTNVNSMDTVFSK